jgi:hypothetical protein
MILIGLDISLRSPGFAIFDQTLDTWKLFGFAQRKDQINFRWSNADKTISIQLLPVIPKGLTDWATYQFIMKHIEYNVLSSVNTSSHIQPIMEGYAYVRPGIAGHSYKLHELGGIVKHYFYTTYQVDTIVIPPTRWKKVCLENGNASKLDTVLSLKQYYPQIDLLNIFQITSVKNDNVVHPIQDLADAVCLILAYTRLTINGKLTYPEIKQNKKRKKHTGF